MKALSVQQLSKVYKNGVLALKEINLAVAEGDFFALLGANGAGKTTLIGIISSIVNKTSGKVAIFNYDIDKDFSAAKALLGVVPQEFNFNIFDKVEQNLIQQAGYHGIPAKIARQRCEFYLKKMGLWEKRQTAINRLSGGMKRRLMIARALIHEPKLLILDEPTAGVDVELRYLIWQFLRELNQQGVTIILTTHYLEEAETLCKNLAILDQGQIIEQSSMADLRFKLHKETLLLHLAQSLKAAPALSFPAKLVEEKLLEVEVTKNRTLNELFTELNQQHVTVMGIDNKTGRLEELFLNLTTDKYE